jgi:hypothetical protein
VEEAISCALRFCHAFFLSLSFQKERDRNIDPPPLLIITGNGMKTLIGLITLLITISSSDLNAQLLRTYGIKAGTVRAEQVWEYTQPSGLDASWISPVWGVDAGVFAEFLNSENFSLLTELHYIQKGCTFTIVGTAIDPD